MRFYKFRIDLDRIFKLQPGTFKVAFFKKGFPFFKMNLFFLFVRRTAVRKSGPSTKKAKENILKGAFIISTSIFLYITADDRRRTQTFMPADLAGK